MLESSLIYVYNFAYSKPFNLTTSQIIMNPAILQKNFDF